MSKKLTPMKHTTPLVELVEIKVYHHATCTWVSAWVTKQEALITHQPGLVPPPGHSARA